MERLRKVSGNLWRSMTTRSRLWGVFEPLVPGLEGNARRVFSTIIIARTIQRFGWMEYIMRIAWDAACGDYTELKRLTE